MVKCANCGSSDADVDLALCFECFCIAQGPEEQYPNPTDEEYCAVYGHGEYENSGRCWCGEKIYEPNFKATDLGGNRNT
jgi:hypothetical protein